MSDQVGNQNVGFLMTRLICSPGFEDPGAPEEIPEKERRERVEGSERESEEGKGSTRES